jgi:two-component system, response regulator / RNA-binding antiterminator
VLTGSVPPNPDEADLSYLRHAQAVVEQAKGLLMARFGCGPDVAFELLRGASQYSNVKVHVIAERLVSQGLPSPS